MVRDRCPHKVVDFTKLFNVMKSLNRSLVCHRQALNALWALKMLENVSAQSTLSSHHERCEELLLSNRMFGSQAGAVWQPRDCGWLFVGDGWLALDAMMTVVHNGALSHVCLPERRSVQRMV